MENDTLKRELVGMFFKDETDVIRLNNLVVLQKERSRSDGAIYVSKQHYDVDYSKQYGYIFHMSGFGGPSPIEVSGLYFVKGNPEIKEEEPQWVDPRDTPPWLGEGTKAIRARNPTCRLSELPLAFLGAENGDLLLWLQDNGIEQESVWCEICGDCFPRGDDWNLCKHCWWCDKTGEYSTPSERCECKSRDECRDDV